MTTVDQPRRERIRDDLRGIVRGDILFDDISCALYSTDASIFQVQPLGVVVPRDEADVQTVVRYAGEHQVPLIARGAGTGVAGESLGPGLILDLSQHFRQILEIGRDTVRVQPGVVYRELSAQLARVGRRFAPDPAHGECTLGGMLANNASGAHALRHGYTRDHVEALRAVLDNGEAVPVGQHLRWPVAEGLSGRLGDIVFSVATLLEQNAERIRACQPRTRFNRCGYLLHDVILRDRIDLARLLVGSEGTLAVFTEATLRTIPLPAGQAVVLLGFDSLDAALRATQKALPTGPAACDLLDRRLVRLAREGETARGGLVSPAAEAVLLVAYEADSMAEARAAATELADRLTRTDRLALQARVAVEPDEMERFWGLREAALPSLYGLRGGTQPLAFIEDVGVPLEALADYLHRVQEVLQEHETTASFLVHAATGQVHARPFLDLQRPEHVARLRALAEIVHGLALDLGGTVSTQHGTGLARTPWVARQYGPLYPVLRELKAIFDPRHLFNPGKIVEHESAPPAWPLRRLPAPDGAAEAPDSDAAGEKNGTGAAAADRKPPPWLLRWAVDEVRSETVTCNGCGHCRTEAPTQRMCPIFRAGQGEAATPRAKANLLRVLLQEKPQDISSDEVRGVADLCINCKMCAHECPAHVNIPKLMLEAKAANVAEHGLGLWDRALARTESFAYLGSVFALAVNTALKSRNTRWLLETLFGVSRRRRLPPFAARHFLHRARRRGWTTRPPAHRPRVAYFVDIFANYNDPMIGEAVGTVLHHNGIEVYVPPGQRGCGMAPLAYGDVETARDTVQHNLRIFADLVREGYTIVCSEPTAALMLRQDSRDLLDDPDVTLVAEHTVELTTYLWDLHRQGRLRTDFQPLELAVGHHIPCHLKALGHPPRGPALLALIPRLRVRTIDVSCSGMAGTFGLKPGNDRLSLEAGRPMLTELRRPGVLFGATECSACRMQMEDGAGKRTLHPAQYLALAYGLLPELSRRLHEPIRDMVLR
jgi:FAD/FMN-containing dehydrogenase/Fe-S oxidoreductase